jgi:hypothetical protein
MYVAGQVVTGMGGGVCIPSTALYNAALLSDMEIVERYNHSGPVSYATPGLDAAVVYGLKDLRFRNTSDGPVVVHASVLGNVLSVGISGKPVPGKRVEVERIGFRALPFTETKTADETVPQGEPQVKQAGRDGWIATVSRTVFQDGKVLRRETVSRDVVAPRGRVVVANPLDVPDSPEAKAAAEAALAEPETTAAEDAPNAEEKAGAEAAKKPAVAAPKAAHEKPAAKDAAAQPAAPKTVENSAVNAPAAKAPAVKEPVETKALDKAEAVEATVPPRSGS